MSEIIIHTLNLPCELPSSTLISRFFTDHEKVKYSRLKLSRVKIQFSWSRLLTKQVLSTFLSIAPGQLHVEKDEYGKPRVLGLTRQGKSLHFNVSHTKGLAVVALSDCSPLGIDVEHCAREVDIRRFVTRFFHSDEQAVMETLIGDPLGKEYFFRIWTRKEAVLKYLGLGLGVPLSSFTTCNIEEKNAVKIMVNELTAKPGLPGLPCYVTDLPLHSPYIGSVASTCASPQLHVKELLPSDIK